MQMSASGPLSSGKEGRGRGGGGGQVSLSVEPRRDATRGQGRAGRATSVRGARRSDQPASAESRSRSSTTWVVPGVLRRRRECSAQFSDSENSSEKAHIILLRVGAL